MSEQTIRLKDEKYKDFEISFEKVRGKPFYDVTVFDKRLGKATRIRKFPSKNKRELIKKIKVELDKLYPQARSWLKRKKYLEQKYGIRKLTREKNKYRGYSFIYFYKGLKWRVEIRPQGKTIIKYNEYPYGDEEYKKVDWDEISRSQGSIEYRFKADLELQIREALRRIREYKELKKKLGTFGIDPNKLNPKIITGKKETSYKGFRIIVEYFINKTEKEINLVTFIYKDKHLITTDSYTGSFFFASDSSEQDLIKKINEAFNKAKDWIAKEVIYNMKGVIDEYDMNKPIIDFKQNDYWDYEHWYENKNKDEWDEKERMEYIMGKEEYEKRNRK